MMPCGFCNMTISQLYHSYTIKSAIKTNKSANRQILFFQNITNFSSPKFGKLKYVHYLCIGKTNDINIF